MMRKALILLVVLATTVAAMAQPKGYECTYQEKMNIGSQLGQLDAAAKEAVMAYMSKRKSFYTLTYADGKSYFERNALLSDDEMGMGSATPTTYVDFSKKTQITQQNFFGRNFIIADSMSHLKWEFTKETRLIAGLPCTKAVTKDSTEVVAWFSTVTPIPAGPYSFYGLPGLVTEVTMGPITYTLTEIKPLTKKPDIKAPNKGKKVTSEEYAEIVQKKLSEMGLGNIGGNSGSGIQIITQ